MATPCSQDLRDGVLAAYDRGMPTKAIAEVFAVSRAWARGIQQRRRETGETEPLPMAGARSSRSAAVRLAELVREQPDATLQELCERLGIRDVESATCMALKKLGWSFKERRTRGRAGPP